jgi:D-alanine-D-alanine ligase
MSVVLPPLRITDPALFGHVAVLMGGTSSEREVSLDSGRNVLAALRARGVKADAVDGIPNLVRELQSGHFDRVFNILHGNKGGGEDGVLQGLLEALGMPYTGSGVLGSALSMDKIRSKQVWLALGLPTPRYVRLARGADVHAAARELGLPVIVKPACEGSSVGVSRVYGDADLDAAVALAASYPGELLVEQLIESDGGAAGEYTIGVLDGQALASIHIVPKGDWYDYNAKYVAEDTQYICPGLDEAGEAQARELAERAFTALELRGWARVDFMRDRDGRNWLLEANTAPGMTSHSLMPKSAGAFGVSFEELCWRILETAT